MSQRYTVTAFDRRTLGHPNYWRAGRSWPSGQSVEVEVLDQDQDPVVTETKNGEDRTFPHPTQIGRISWKAIMADGQLMKQPVGATTDQALDMQAKIDELIAKLATVTARADLAEQAVVDLRAQVQSAQDRRDEAEAAAKRLDGEVDDVHTALKAAEVKIAKLTGERDELQTQLEQLTAPSTKPEGEPAKVDEPAQPKTQGKGKNKG